MYGIAKRNWIDRSLFPSDFQKEHVWMVQGGRPTLGGGSVRAPRVEPGCPKATGGNARVITVDKLKNELQSQYTIECYRLS